jgi:hypothetical protein
MSRRDHRGPLCDPPDERNWNPWRTKVGFFTVVTLHLLPSEQPEQIYGPEFGAPPEYLWKLAERVADRVLVLVDGDIDSVEREHIMQATAEIAPHWAMEP